MKKKKDKKKIEEKLRQYLGEYELAIKNLGLDNKNRTTTEQKQCQKKI